jgi:MYXO-CTERM domain-containing protein
MTTMPFCINVQHSDAGVDAGTMGRCAGCRTDGDCSGQTPVCEPTLKVCVQCTDTRLDVCSATGSGAICLPDETCGCAADSDCGAADSGRICDLITTHKCVAGCRVVGGNGCPSGLICDGAGLVPGKCVAFVDMATNIPDASEQDLSVPIDMAQNTSFRLQGGGIGCSVGGPTDVSFGAFVLLALAALGLRRRRRQ